MQKARIRLSSVKLDAVTSVCEQIEHVCQNQGIKKFGPIPLPTKHLRVPVMKNVSGQGTIKVSKFEMRIHKRLIDIIEPSNATIESLTNMDLPAGVGIEIKM